MTLSIKISAELLAAVEGAAAAAGETRHGWLLGAVRARLAAGGDVVEGLRAARAEAAARLAELDAALLKAPKDGVQPSAPCPRCSAPSAPGTTARVFACGACGNVWQRRSG